MKLVAKKDFVLKNDYYTKGEEVKCNDFNTIIKLNEKGFIEPLDTKDLFKIKKELETPKYFKKEEE